jgi:hypothetical protein
MSGVMIGLEARLLKSVGTHNFYIQTKFVNIYCNAHAVTIKSICNEDGIL